MAAFDATVVWEIRSATGSDNNGGGFVPGSSGSDFSQQASPQYSLTGLASAGAGDTILSAAAAADMVGNVAHALSGTNVNVGFYRITSVVVGVSVTFTTNAAGQSICSGVAASLALNIGGAIATVATYLANMVSGNLAWLKGSNTITTSLTLLTSSLTNSLIGYGTTRGDNVRATITTSTNSVDVFLQGTLSGSPATNWILQNLDISSSAGTPGKGINCGVTGPFFALDVINCRIHGCSNGIFGDFNTVYTFVPLTLVNVEVDHCTGKGVVNSGSTYFYGCYIHDNGDHGCEIETAFGNYQEIFAISTVFASNAGSGIKIFNASASSANTRAANFYNCAFWTNTASGIEVPNNNTFILNLINNNFQLNGAYGINLAGDNGFAFQLNNSFRANTTANRHNFSGNATDITLTAECFTAPGSGDFTLNGTAGGGAALKGQGFQSDILG